MSLTPIKGCMHVHSNFCDGKNTMAEMAEAALAAGVRYLGFSGHAHTPCPYDEDICMNEEQLRKYRLQLDLLQNEYECRMDIMAGIEWDACSDGQRPGWIDYWIGSVHNLYDEKTGEYYCVDWNEDELRRCIDKMFGGDAMAMVRHYYEQVAKVAAEKPDILGHIDLITKLNGRNKFFDEASREYQDAAKMALRAIDPQKTLLEINTGAVARGYRERPYPAPFLLREWNRIGGKVIITSDAHNAKDIVFGYDMAAQAAMAAGFQSSVLMGWHGWVDCQL